VVPVAVAAAVVPVAVVIAHAMAAAAPISSFFWRFIPDSSFAMHLRRKLR
jgi:hypothetical protein